MLKEKKENLLERYFNQKIMYNEGKNYQKVIKIIICTIIFFMMIIIHASNSKSSILNGITSQIELFISIYLTVSIMHIGYFSALILNLIELIQSIYAVIFLGHKEALIGIVIILFSFLAMSIIEVLLNRNYLQFKNTYEQKEEITMLYEELAASEEELREQNEQLMESNQKILSDADKLNHLAYYDMLTDLPNRKMIFDKLSEITKSINDSFAVVFIDLNNFKKINDTLGHESGDLLIKSFAARLISEINDNDILVRLGGDEFALIIQEKLNENEILNYVKRLHDKIKEPFLIEKSEFRTSACFGIALYPKDGTNPSITVSN